MTDAISLPKSFKTLPERLRRYLWERLPLWQTLAVVGASSYSAITFPAMLAHRDRAGIHVYVIAFLLGYLFRIQRRVIDDLRNAPRDRKERPNMPIPRGLVSANELRGLFAFCIPLQAVLLMMLNVTLLGPLLVVQIFLQGLTFDFGLRPLMRKHPVFSLFSRMLAAPMVMYVLTACEWLPRHGSPPVGVILLILVSFSNSFVLELGRKIRAPSEAAQDPAGFTVLWGARRSTVVWWLLINVSAIFSSLARILRGAPAEGMLVLLAGVLITGFFAYHFTATLRETAAKRLETLSVLWTVTMFLTVVLR